MTSGVGRDGREYGQGHCSNRYTLHGSHSKTCPNCWAQAYPGNGASIQSEAQYVSTDDSPEYRGPDIPSPLGEQLRVALGLDTRPRTFGNYVDAMASLVDRAGLDVDLDTLCTTDASPHRATFRGETQHYHCTLDALIVPFLADDVEQVDIRTVSPVSGDTITFTVTESTIDPDPPDAVLSFGVAADVEAPPTDSRSPALAYRRICPYGKAFGSRAEYEQWADETEAYTMAITTEDSFELARALGRVA